MDTMLQHFNYGNLTDLFIGVRPMGISYCDRSRERDGDYYQVAFLPFKSLTLLWWGSCSPAMGKGISAHAAAIQARKGEQYEVSTSGQTVTLGL